MRWIDNGIFIVLSVMNVLLYFMESTWEGMCIFYKGTLIIVLNMIIVNKKKEKFKILF